MSTMIESMESRTLFSIPAYVTAEIRELRTDIADTKLDITLSKKAATADFNALVLTLKANDEYKPDRTLLAALSKQANIDRTRLIVQTNRMTSMLNLDTTVLVNAFIAYDNHPTAGNYIRELRASNKYFTVEDSIVTTLEDLRDTEGSDDLTHLNAIAAVGNTSAKDQVDSIEADTTEGETNFADAVQITANEANTVIGNYDD